MTTAQDILAIIKQAVLDGERDYYREENKDVVDEPHRQSGHQARFVLQALSDAGLEIVEKTEEQYLIWSNEHRAWWRPGSQGYCRDVRKAGLYSKEKAVGMSFNGRDGWCIPDENPDEIAVPLSSIPELMRPGLTQDQACLTCNGRGEISGQLQSGDWQTDPCPDCSPQAEDQDNG